MDAIGTWGQAWGSSGAWLVALLVALLVLGVAWLSYAWGTRGRSGEFAASEPEGREGGTTPEYRIMPTDVRDEDEPPSSL